MLEKKYIKLKLTGKTKDEILQELVEVLDNGGALENKDGFLKVVKEREATSSTGLEEGIAIPHGKTKAVRKPAVAFGRSEGVDFNSLDGEKVRIVILVGVPKGESKKYLELLSSLSRIFRDKKIRESILESTTTECLIEAIAEIG